jgi:hypothetical protein
VESFIGEKGIYCMDSLIQYLNIFWILWKMILTGVNLFNVTAVLDKIQDMLFFKMCIKSRLKAVFMLIDRTFGVFPTVSWLGNI